MDTQSSASFEGSYRAMMTGVFVGIVDAVICCIYNVVFRSSRHYFSSTLLNISYIIFGMLFVFFLIGLVFMLLHRLTGKADLIFVLLFCAGTILAVSAIRSGHFSPDPVEDISLRGEYTGVTIISGILATIGIPLLHRSHKFELYVV